MSAGAGILLLLAAYAVTVTWQARALAAERDRVRAEASKSDLVKNFMTEVFGAADPFESVGIEVTARDLLERAAQRIDALESEPEVVSELRLALGDVYFQLGANEQAERQQRRALERCDEVPAAQRASCFAGAQFALGPTVRKLSRRYQEAEGLLAASVAGYRALQPGAVPPLAEAHNELGLVFYFDHRYLLAEAEFREALRLHRSVETVEPPAIAGSTANLAMALSSQGQSQQSLEL